MNENLTYSKPALAMTERFEGCRLEAYQDQGGVWTIGYGHTAGVKQGDRCTLFQAQTYLINDLQAAEFTVQRFVTVPLNQGEFDALVDFVFNLGPKDFRESTLLKLLNTGDYIAAANQFDLWDHCGGKVVAGLLRRREAERQEFLSN